MRTAPPQGDATLDMIFDAGQRARDLEIVQGQLEEAKRKLAPLPLRKRAWGLVSSILLFGFTAFMFYLIGEYRAIQILENRMGEAIPTASVQDRTPMPTTPYAPPPASGGGDSPPAYEEAISTYNEQQEQRATALQATQEGSGQAGAQAAPVDAEATAQAWLAAPVSTPTPTPGIEEAAMNVAAVVVDAAFDASFEDAPECSPFIGYLAGSECARLFAAETATAGE